MNDLEALVNRIKTLSAGQFALLNSIVETFELPISAWRLDGSDIVNSEFLAAFGDMLKLHHTLSVDYLDKHRFEAVMERVCKALGREASRPKKNNPGHDLTVDGVAWSLKTQGDASIRKEELHISKFMELGKGKREDEKDLLGLRDMFLEHMNAYSRVFQLRYFALAPAPSMPASHFYELVEIPKALLQEASNGEFEMRHKSKQTPKPGYCTVRDESGEIKFQLYFDGGTERKLQIKHLQKGLCTVHASWEF
jgi:type II restriction enzyme